MSSKTNQASSILMEEPVKASWFSLSFELKEQIIRAFLDNVLENLEFGKSEHINIKSFRTLGDMKRDDCVYNIYDSCMNATKDYFEKHFKRDVAALVRASPSTMIGLITQVTARMRKDKSNKSTSSKWRRLDRAHFEIVLLRDVAFEVTLQHLLVEAPEDDQTKIVMSSCMDQWFSRR